MMSLLSRNVRCLLQLLCLHHLLDNGCYSLSFFSTESKVPAKPIQKVAVIGSGIAGLSIAHALTNNIQRNKELKNEQKKQIQVNIYESRSSFDTVSNAGAGVQLNGGLAVLGNINPMVQDAVYNAGIPMSRIQSKCKPWFQGKDTASTENMDRLLEVDLLQAVESAGDDISSSLIQTMSNNNKRLNWISIMRGTIQKTLMDTLPKDTNQVSLQYSKKLSHIETCKEKNLGVMCHFDDGSVTGPFDVVIGCDGINSRVKSFIDNNNGSDESAIYSGIRIRYAVADQLNNPKENLIQEKESVTLSQYFGDGAYALHGRYGAGEKNPIVNCACVIYFDEDYIGPFKKDPTQDQDKGASTNPTTNKVKDENVDWTQDKLEQNLMARQTMEEQLRSSGIPINVDDPLGGTITKANRFFDLGIYFHNPFQPWSRPIDPKSSHAYAVLCGDSAHALPPFLGQGANQAIQDAYTLAEQLHTYNEKVWNGEITNSKELNQYLIEYKTIRSPATFAIFWKSLFLGYLEVGGTNGVYAKFRDTVFTVLGFLGVAKKVILSAAKLQVKSLK